MRVYSLQSTKAYIPLSDTRNLKQRREESAMLEFEALLFSHILKSSGMLGQKDGLTEVLEPILLPQLAAEICKGCDLGIAELIEKRGTQMNADFQDFKNRGTESTKVIKRSEEYYELSR